MTMTDAKLHVKMLTADDLMRLSGEGVRGELIRGVLCETMPAGMEHGVIVANMVLALGNFVKPRQLGRIAASDIGVWLERDPDTVREPDIAFFSATKIPAGVRVSDYAEIVPDLVVEVVSPSNSTREINDKARMWLNHGVRLVWVLYPDTRTVAVHPRDDAVMMLDQADVLDGRDVLPGFTCNLVDIFD